MYCRNCGSQIADNAPFCPKCGNPISAAPAGAAPMPAAAPMAAAPRAKTYKPYLLVGLVGVVALVVVAAMLLVPRLLPGEKLEPVFVIEELTVETGDQSYRMELAMDRAEDGAIDSWHREMKWEGDGNERDVERTYTYENGCPVSVESTTDVHDGSDPIKETLEVDCEFDEDGRLVAETWEGFDWKETQSYEYDEDGQLKRSDLDDGEYRREQEFEDGRVVSSEDFNVLLTYEWDLDGGAAQLIEAGETTELDIEVDEDGNIVSMYNPTSDTTVTVKWVEIEKPCAYAQFESLNKTPWV
ncbi:Uncharacterised protein [Slackia heliotrinireducens]|uniref:zinc ribbon domain-containing protein n=2 Tax=Slackia heliotrinireducens TaxID=84110 RepID=UPI000A03AF5E|nr:zinc ribbon domain-containing protein [Slackia heliotrinireducens]VEH03459.1 Uncharacterised protein [Slackia heliotrinireducens]